MTKILENIAHQRADFAYKCSEEASKKKYKKDYRAYIRRLPMQIKTNGLAQTMAFFNSKSKEGNAYKKIYNELHEWVRNKREMFRQPEPDSHFIKALVNEEPASYRAITMEVLSILEWWKRFVEALIEDDEGSQKDGL
ncbi:MAG: type III-B CRISPR module-associated protein Cmr5 [Bacteroidota bacterium]